MSERVDVMWRCHSVCISAAKLAVKVPDGTGLIFKTSGIKACGIKAGGTIQPTWQLCLQLCLHSIESSLLAGWQSYSQIMHGSVSSFLTAYNARN